MPHNGETRGARRSRAPEITAVAADALEFTTKVLTSKQSSRLMRRLGITRGQAKALVELAYGGGE